VRPALANVRIAVHIQHRLPNGRADRGPNWYKHLLEQWTEAMGVNNRGCALMRAQTCAQHHIYSIGARRAGPIKPKIGTKTHWGNGHKLWWSACAQRQQRALSAQSGRSSRPAQARSARTSAERTGRSNCRDRKF
jgi:hypothetical protein